MNIEVKHPVALVTVFIWVGFLCAISFMEAWLKFDAPGVTLSIGLQVTRLIFNTLNKIEWVFALIIFTHFFLDEVRIYELRSILYFIPLIFLIIQTFVILPALNARVEMHIQGEEVAESVIHLQYVDMEIVKVILLLGYGLWQFKLS
ncbi:MAG: hypothetical protein ABJN36_10770 [Cyclobacteriaceae bacterium]